MDDSRIVCAAISELPITAAQAEEEVWTQTAGAVVAFSGIVRNHDAGRTVERLSYTAHPTAPEALRQAAQQCAHAHPEVRIWAAHRIGELEIGDTALVAACASPHRAEAFDSCQDLVNIIKRTVPIWKEQHYDDGTKAWLGLS